MILTQFFIFCNGMKCITKIGVKRGIKRTFNLRGGYVNEDNPHRKKKKKL